MARPARQPRKKAEPAGRTLAHRIAAAPLSSAPMEARRKISAWLTEIARTAAGKNLKRLLAGSPKLQSLTEGLADGSPYLWELASAEPARLLALLQSDPDA